MNKSFLGQCINDFEECVYYVEYQVEEVVNGRRVVEDCFVENQWLFCIFLEEEICFCEYVDIKDSEMNEVCKEILYWWGEVICIVIIVQRWDKDFVQVFDENKVLYKFIEIFGIQVEENECVCDNYCIKLFFFQEDMVKVVKDIVEENVCYVKWE